MENYKLPNLIIYEFHAIENQLEKFDTKLEKLDFLNFILIQTELDAAKIEWQKDSLNCCKQFKEKPVWQGVFDAFCGEYRPELAVNIDAYNMGIKHYKFYHKLKELIEKVNSESQLVDIVKEKETKRETPTFTNNFDNIKPTEIYKHFKAGLVEKGYLTEQELNEYLKAAFELQTKPEILFKLKHTPTKQKIYTVFYIYYKDISQKKHERQKEYAALLGDFFEGYKTETIQTNWARDYKKKR
jgi:hypothetical protein